MKETQLTHNGARVYADDKGRLYAVCAVCDSLVRINKPLIGGLHVCLTDDEIKAKRSGRA